MRQMAAVLLLACALVAASAASAHSLQPGDRLVYDVTVEAQEHRVPPAAAGDELTISSVGAGTETIVVGSIDSAGRAHALVTTDIQGRYGDAPVVIRRTTPATISPSGEIVVAQSIDPLIDQALLLANEGVRDFATRALYNGLTWRLSTRAQTYPMTIEYRRSAGAVGRVGKLPAVAIASVGAGGYDSGDAARPLTATTTIAGTYYYDQRDRLFVGEALRDDLLVASGSRGAHTNTTTTINFVLRSLDRVAPAAATPAGSASPSSSPAPLETPTAVPTGLRPQTARMIPGQER